MEDPWASGPVYDQTPKPANDLPSPHSPIRSAPVSDPWGEPIPIAQSRPNVSPGDGWISSPPKAPTADLQVAAPSWGGGWDEQPEAGPSRSPIRRPADSPEWSTSNPQEQDDTNHGMALSDLDIDQTTINRSSSPAEEFPSPTGGFTQDTTPASPKSALPEMGRFDEPNLPASPTFGDDFGGFSSFGDDPWGPKKEDSGWGQSADRQSTGTSDPDAEDEVEPEEGDGWGRSTSMERGEETKNTQVGMDQEWEEAQKRIKVTEQRAPREKIVNLQDDWRGLAQDVIGDNRLVERPDDEEDAYNRKLRLQEDDTRETLRSLSTIPPDTNTYPPVLSSMETHERYRYALSRPNPHPETSLLNIPLSRRVRQNENLADSLDSWTSRSRLGEPEPLPVESSTQAEDVKPKWSFWRKNTAEKPLVTSGGGILEAKSISNSSTPAPIESRPPLNSAASVSSANNTSRPASPAPPSIPAVISAADSSPNVPHPAASSDPAVPAQSAVTRFFGRLSRRQTAQPNTEEDDNKDLALSADDFSFLDQVPSITSPKENQNVGDLLAYEGGRTESMASLESMLNSKPTPLPAALAPPPAWSGATNTAGNPDQKHKQVDLLEGLDFGNDMGSLSTPFGQPTSAKAVGSASSASDWDQLLTTSSSKPPSSTNTSMPTSAVPMMTSSPAAGPSSRPFQPQQPVTPSGMGDFDDFNDFAPAVSAPSKPDDFDDFGDFGDFSTPPPPAVQPRPYLTPTNAASSLKGPPSTGHVKRSSLDHTPTLNLINDASAVKGRRWPAPPSPLAPQLDPPPRAANISTSFPFISPPPGGSRPSSGFGDLLDDGVKMTNPISQPSPPKRVQSPPIAPSLPMMPPRTASPLSRPPSTMGSLPLSPNIAKPHQASHPGQSGLSAQDLSFFDSL